MGFDGLHIALPTPRRPGDALWVIAGFWLGFTALRAYFEIAI